MKGKMSLGKRVKRVEYLGHALGHSLAQWLELLVKTVICCHFFRVITVTILAVDSNTSLPIVSRI